MSFVWETPEEINLALAKRLSCIRKRRNLSQVQLSEKSNVSYGSIKRFETSGQISLLSLTKLCVALGCVDEIKNLAIERAINESDLGLNPSNDGMIIRLPIPMLTEERRREFVKQCKDYAEHARVGIRKARQDANARIDKAKKASEISEDDAARAKEKVQKLTDKNIATVDELFKKKESDLMTV